MGRLATFAFTIIVISAASPACRGEKTVKLNGYTLADETPEWFVCEKDDDCVDVTYPCAGGIVNKKFEKQAQALYSNQAAARDCGIYPPPKDAPLFKVLCKDKKCTSQGRSPRIK